MSSITILPFRFSILSKSRYLQYALILPKMKNGKFIISQFLKE